MVVGEPIRLTGKKQEEDNREAKVLAQPVGAGRRIKASTHSLKGTHWSAELDGLILEEWAVHHSFVKNVKRNRILHQSSLRMKRTGISRSRKRKTSATPGGGSVTF